MKYKVKELAKLSGVSVRTLHWYDKIGLLKPSFHGLNGYRYYVNKQLLILQQILFFRELGFSLNDIQKMLEQTGFDKIKALNVHKSILEKDIDRKRQLIDTINKTIIHLKEKQIMSNEELYHGFDKAKQKEYEQYLVKSYGTKAEELMMESKKRTAKWDKDEWDTVQKEGDILHKDLANAIEAAFAPESDEVQKIIQRHFEIQSRFYTLTKEVYIGLSQLYSEHPDFKKFFDVYHPKMIEFLGKAIKHYANKNL